MERVEGFKRNNKKAVEKFNEYMNKGEAFIVFNDYGDLLFTNDYQKCKGYCEHFYWVFPGSKKVWTSYGASDCWSDYPYEKLLNEFYLGC